MYNEEVIDHSKYPRNQGKLDDFDVEVEGANASCGDEVKFYLKLNEGRVSEVGVVSEGCALSTAAASILSELIAGKTLEEIKKMNQLEVESLMGKINLGRIKCVRLPLEVLKSL